jgi:hypothetical protein
MFYCIYVSESLVLPLGVLAIAFDTGAVILFVASFSLNRQVVSGLALGFFFSSAILAGDYSKY